MKKALGVGAALVTMALAIPAIALEVGGTTLPTADDAALTSALEAEGYTVTSIEREDDEIEVYAMRDGQRFEIETNKAGLVTVIELEDDD